MESIETYKNRAFFANTMLDRYYAKSPNLVVSDIGAGFGHMKDKIESLGRKWQPFDYVKKLDETIIWNLNDEAPNGVANAGIVVFLEVLEHLDNPLLGLQNITKHLDKNGIIILTTPNPQSSKNILSLFLRGNLYAFQEKHLKENHVFTPWKHIVEHFLKICGYEILEYATVDNEYIHQKPKSIKDWFKTKIESYIEHRNPLAKGLSYGIVARKIK